MIDIDKSVYKDVWDYAYTIHGDTDNCIKLYADICNLLHSIERDDDRDGTDTLERLLYSPESLSIAEIVDEYGIE